MKLDGMSPYCKSLNSHSYSLAVYQASMPHNTDVNQGYNKPTPDTYGELLMDLVPEPEKLDNHLREESHD